MLRRKVGVIYLIVAALAGSGLTLLFFSLNSSHAANEQGGVAISNDGSLTGGDISVVRNSHGYQFISSIIAVDPANESVKYKGLKTQIENYISGELAGGKLQSASVYFKEFNGNEWFAINPTLTYFPGSLLKVGVLITYQLMAEKDPKLMTREVTYRGEKGFAYPVERFGNDTVVEGKKYSVKELLEHMIRFSDNRATVFLENYMDTTIFKKEFSELGITSPRFNDPTYALNVKEYSILMRALYNAGYIRKRASNESLKMLSESKFKEGLLKELPSDVLVAHKYGEAGDRDVHELHETGIFYLDHTRYLVTVMTKGNDWDELSKVIGHISKIAYDDMSRRAN